MQQFKPTIPKKQTNSKLHNNLLKVLNGHI